MNFLILLLLFIPTIVGHPYEHSYLNNFDIIRSTDIKENVIVTRDTGIGDTRKIYFSALNRKFKLILNEQTDLISPSFKIFTIDKDGLKKPFTYKGVEKQVLQGHLEGDPNSMASATFMDPKSFMTTHIKTSNDFIIVEPTYLHQDNLKISSKLSINNTIDNTIGTINDTMIVYNLSDLENIMPFKPQEYCGHINMSDYLPRYDIKFRSKRSDEPQKTRCSIMLVVDTMFYYNIGRRSLTTTVNYILGLMDRVNMIYLNTTWGNEEQETIDKIGFTVQTINIHTEFHSVSHGEKHYNMETNKVWGALEYLENFSRHADSRFYCLAHLLTYRKFNSTVLGLAFVASARRGSVGGICSERFERDGQITYFNTGISTSLSVSGETLITRQADLVVAHELGHNFGAEHDIQDLNCSPKPSKGGAYLMHAYSVPGFEKNNRHFSPCSRSSIWQVLRSKSHVCFSKIQEEVCGNGIVEKGEECDGGNIGLGIEDQCCDPNCRLRPGTQCSDRHSPCCSNCQINPANSICRHPEPNLCKQGSYCDGTKPECPPALPSENGTKCFGSGECRLGECMPFCETKGLISCQCELPETACKLCCKSWFEDRCLPYFNDSTFLADGTLCYRGVCEKGRCEQQVQDVVERFWDIVEDINLSTIARFLRDNIVIFTLLISIPIWLIGQHLVDKFDKMLMLQLANEVISNTGKSSIQDDEQPSHPSAFLPTYFGDSTTIHLNDVVVK